MAVPLVRNAPPKPVRMTAAERQQQRRDPKGWRTAKKTSRFGGRTKAGEQAAADRAATRVRMAVRRAVWVRSGGVCEVCGDTESQTAAKWPKATHEMHETRKRSETRRMAPEERYNLSICARACVECHRRLERHLIDLRTHSASGVDGSFDVVDHRSGEVLRTVSR